MMRILRAFIGDWWQFILLFMAIGAVLGWVLRIDALRAHYKSLLEQVAVVLVPAPGKPPRLDKLPAEVGAVLAERDLYRRERDNARGVVRVQSDSINAYAAETARLGKLSEENRKLAEATIRERDQWIRRAQSAETRTERLSAEAELKECEEVLDALYRDRF